MISFSTGKLRKKTWIRFLFKLLPQTEKNSWKGFEKKCSKHLIGHLQRFFWSLIWIFTNIFWKSSWMEMEMLLQIGSDIIVALITLSLGDPSNFFLLTHVWIDWWWASSLWFRKPDHSYRKPQISCLVFHLFKNVSDYFRLRFPHFPTNLIIFSLKLLLSARNEWFTDKFYSQ